jgi:ribosomal-protein-alanine N-acetyltransferase
LPCKYIGNDEYEFGFILATKFWAKGYAREIGKA